MQTTQLILNITKCPEGSTGSKVIDIPKSGGSIGRDPVCTVTLVDNDRFISSSHCLIYIYGETYYISDVSTNGTFVNGVRILKNQPISIHDGDFIALGCYEMRLSFEMSASAQDIAADIVSQRETSDPLSYFEEHMPLNENEASDLEELFITTQNEDINKEDPLAHLDFSLIEKEDALINGKPIKNDHINNENAAIKEDQKSHHSRQIQDDSDSIFAHFDTPTFITEDWIKNPLNNASENPSPPKNLIMQAMASHDLMAVHQPSQNENLQIEQSLEWEDLEKAPSFSKGVKADNALQIQNASMHSSDKSKETSQDLGLAFFQGLGISDRHCPLQTPDFFQSMGAALRICIDKLQRDLLEIEKLKSSQDPFKSENVLELMLALNDQNLLSPNELIEQILDELDEHKTQAQKAMKEAVCAELKTYDPHLFAKQLSSTSLFITKRQLWRKYVAFFNEKSKQVDK